MVDCIREEEGTIVCNVEGGVIEEVFYFPVTILVSIDTTDIQVGVVLDSFSLEVRLLFCVFFFSRIIFLYESRVNDLM